MAFDTFLKITGIEGESTAKGAEKQIEIFSFSWGASNPSTVGPGSGGISAGRVTLSSFRISKKTDKASALLFKACCTNEHKKEAVVSIRKATGGGQEPYLTYKFSDVMVESIDWAGTSGGDDTPIEAVSLAFGKVEIEYKQQDASGKLNTAGQVSWDVTKVSDS